MMNAKSNGLGIIFRKITTSDWAIQMGPVSAGGKECDIPRASSGIRPPPGTPCAAPGTGGWAGRFHRGILSRMHSLLRALAVVLASTACGRAADPPKAPVDTSFLKEFAETRGFMLGRPQKPKFTPDGKAVLFLRAEAKSPKMKLFEFDVATGKTRELLSPDMLLKGGEENLTPEE